MAYYYTIIYTRPSTDIPFYSLSPEVNQHIDTVWRVDDKMTTSEIFSDDGLTKISSVTFKDYADWLKFINDDIIKSYMADRNNYHSENGITITRLEG